MTKFNIFAFGVCLILALNKVDINNQAHLAQLNESCMAVKSNLPMNHTRHPCNHLYASNQSIWSWLSSDNQSAHLHFLDWVELLQFKLNLFNKSV
jgi:hypothetical protein